MDGENLLVLAEKLRLRRPRLGMSNLVASCPFARYRHIKEDGSFGFDKKASFGIKIVENGESVFNCLACESRGDLLTLCRELGDLRGKDYSALEEWIWQAEAIDAFDQALRPVDEDDEDDYYGPNRRKAQIKKRRKDVYPESEYEPFRGSVPRYAYDRGLTPQVCKDWDLGHDPIDKRLMIPVRRRDGALVGLKGRDYTDTADNKYHAYLPESQGYYFFGEHMLSGDASRVVIVEGEFDAFKVHMAGFQVLALMGGSATPEHRKKLEVWGFDLVLLPDPNSTGDKWAKRLGEYMKSMVSVYDAYCPPGKDPGSMTLDEIRDAVDRAELRL